MSDEERNAKLARLIERARQVGKDLSLFESDLHDLQTAWNRACSHIQSAPDEMRAVQFAEAAPSREDLIEVARKVGGFRAELARLEALIDHQAS